MSRHDAARPRVAPPEIDCTTPIKLVDQPGQPEQYHQFEPESALAIRAALGACRPLLVRGEPGVGKTQLAAAAARVLRRPLVQKVVEARTDSRDLLWEFDAVMRLAEAQVAGAVGSLVLGQAASDPPQGGNRDPQATLVELLRSRLDPGKFIRPGPLWWGFDWADAEAQARKCGLHVRELEPDTDPRNGCVVLIDEIDKADTDVPNGLLEALGAGEFTPMSRTDPVKVQGQFPLVIITTNEERVLPGAFVRRCLVLHLMLPQGDQALVDFLVARANVHFPQAVQGGKAHQVFEKAARLLVEDRRQAVERHLAPLPGQAEFLDLIRAVLALEPGSPENQLKRLEEVARFTMRKHEEPRS
jgi:MoxR-like ATPase